MDNRRYEMLHEQLIKAGRAGDAARLARQYAKFKTDLYRSYEPINQRQERPVLPLNYYDTTDARSKLESLQRAYHARLRGTGKK